MGLWIRSQDRKRLVKVQYVSISHEDERQICGDVGVAENDFVLGTYVTPERAIEVLDDIQHHVKKLAETEATQNAITKQYWSSIYAVYKMPEK